ncbi:uncharacterized protein [Primulina eburnea]|uniref:uncharacterized protein n=1 Tax=Primulina eburnea TaxID=1245227 RepID=UPI003C6BDC7C
MASIDDYVRQPITDITGFGVGILPFRYLGIPLVAIWVRFSDFNLLLDAMATKISSWPRNSLSYEGKLELIRSVLQGMKCFWFSILPIPSAVIDAIYAMCRKFGCPTKHPPIAWDVLCKPCDDGGMGLKNLKAWNKALLAKTLWKIHLKKDSLWIRWVNHIYSDVGGVWSWGWNKDNSLLIEQIISIRDEIVQRYGSVDAATVCLNGWFGGNQGLSQAYNFFIHNTGRWPWKPLVMKSCILPKNRFLLWLLTHGKLLTRDRLQFVNDKTCVLCNGAEESVAHLYFECAASKGIWNMHVGVATHEKDYGSSAAVLKGV